MGFIRHACAGLAAILALGGCTPLGLIDAFTPSFGYAERLERGYGAHPRQAVDVYRPKAALDPGARLPMVVFFYGGRWQAFEKREFRFVGEALASRGFVAVLPDYRVYPEVTFPAFVEDGAKAVRWARDHAAELGGDPGRIVLMGHSAGAHIAMMLGLDQHFLRAEGVPASALRGTLGMAGPYDFLPFQDEDIKQLMGPADHWPDTQPIRFVDATDPPIFMQYGMKDDLVWPHNARNLKAKAEQAGMRADLVEYDGLDHYGLVASLAAPLRLLGPVLDDAVAFIHARVDAP
jgi:acetyl esterase/lipase